MGQHTFCYSDKKIGQRYEEIVQQLQKHDDGKIWLDDYDVLDHEAEQLHNQLQTPYHDMFRCGKRKENGTYVDDIKLYSLKETLEFIKDPVNRCTTDEHTVEQLQKFFYDYPDGYITFG